MSASRALAASGLLLSLASPARPEDVAARSVGLSEPIRSMGQPAIWKTYGGGYYAFEGAQSRGAAAYLGLYKDLLPSVAGRRPGRSTT